MAHIIAVANQKGGVGKTTTALNLAAGLAMKGKKVLALDMDAQANLTLAAGINPKEIETSITEVLIKESNFTDALKHMDYETHDDKIVTLDILPSTTGLSRIEADNKPMNSFLLKKLISSVKDKYDFIIIDSPPSLGILTVNVLIATEYVLIPTKTDYMSISGIGLIFETINNLINYEMTDSIEILGIIPTMTQRRTKNHQEIMEILSSQYHDYILDIDIPQAIGVAEAPKYGMPLCVYDDGTVSQGYLKLTDFVIEKVGENNETTK